MDEDSTPTPFSLSLTASDADADSLTWRIFPLAGHGTASLSGTGSGRTVNYTPALNYNPSDSFGVEIDDGHSGVTTLTVNVTITPQNDPPVNTAAPEISGTLHVGKVLTASTGTWTDAADITPGTLSYTYHWERASSALGANLAVITSDTASKTYTTVSADNGKYLRVVVNAIDDGECPTEAACSQTASWPSDWVFIGNAAPEITDGATSSVTLDEDGSPTGFSMSLTGADADGDTITWSLASAATNGTATVSGTGAHPTVTYAPNANYNGSDSFTIQASDGLGGVATNVVTVTINPRNDPPNNTTAPSITGTPARRRPAQRG